MFDTDAGTWDAQTDAAFWRSLESADRYTVLPEADGAEGPARVVRTYAALDAALEPGDAWLAAWVAEREPLDATDRQMIVETFGLDLPAILEG